MVTFFTTAKDFTGKNRVNQINAIKSWVIGNDYKCEAIIFNPAEGFEVLNDLSNIIFNNEISTNENGIPFINSMFYQASILASNKVLCFLNADIIINDTFIKSILQIHKKLKKKYLIVGERLDSKFDYLIDFSDPLWYDKLIVSQSQIISEHLPYGSDFFVFPKGQYANENFKLPDLLVGRPGWDNYMIYDARGGKIKLINLSSTTKVIHQDHDYSHKNKNELIKEKEDKYNMNFLPEKEKYTYMLTFCNYKYETKRIKKTYHNNDFKSYYYQECIWGNPSIIKRLILKIEIFLISKFRILRF